MSTLAEITSALKFQYPTLRNGTEEDGYTDLSPAEYDAQISQWAQNQLADEIATADNLAAEQAVIDAQASRNAKLAKMGFTAAEIENW